MMSDTADRTPKCPRLTTDGYEDVVPEECRDDDNAASINGMDLLDDDLLPTCISRHYAIFSPHLSHHPITDRHPSPSVE
jgi:hypothetical protein